MTTPSDEGVENLISHLRSINKDLLNELDEKDTLIEELQEQLENTNHNENNANQNQNTSDKFSKDLVKKNRSLSVQLQREKAKSAKLTQENNSKNENIKKIKQKLKEAERKINEGDGGESAKRISNLEDNLDKANNKIMELRQQHQSNKDQIRKLRATLEKEVGEDEVDKAIEEKSGSWKGRAERIVLLKAKVKDLQTKLDANQPGGSDALSEVEKKLESEEKKRKNERESYEETLQQKQKEIEELKTKTEGHTARVATLEKYSAQLRQKINRLLAKTKDDDALIEALRNELASARKVLSKTSGYDKNDYERMKSETNTLQSAVQSLRTELKQVYETTTQSNVDDSERNDMRIRCAELDAKNAHQITELTQEQLRHTMDSLEHARKESTELKTRLKSIEDKEPPANSPEKMKATIKSLQEEIRSWKEAASSAVEFKDREFKVLKDVVENQRKELSEAREFKKLYEENKNESEINHNNNNSRKLKSLQEDNEQLRNEIDQLKQLYNGAVLSKRSL
eukprot:gb/GECH01010884.1/.p1 GENE.gb/GECH01010884.1/~~gb/GECH01010884.1/.p1  ORF type:complete len:514 (+),score=176.50 gb/GECH01010884.1/:1-1542(+)